MPTPELDNEELEVLRALLDFHQGSDEPGEQYPEAPFERLRDKVEVAAQ